MKRGPAPDSHPDSYVQPLPNDIGYKNDYGVTLLGASQNNTIYNNNMMGTANYDYVCSAPTTPPREYGGINYGASKQGCNWLAPVPKGYIGMNCIVSLVPNYLSLTSDQYDSDYSTCLTIYGNSTTLDCNGHTIIATNSGTLDAPARVERLIIENCYLKNFAEVAQAQDAGVSLINDTIYTNSSVAQGNGALVNVSGGSAEPSYNNITAAYYGIELTNTKFGTSISNNRVSVGVGKRKCALYNASDINVYNNNATRSSGIGLVLNNSVGDNFQNNNFGGTAIGMQCTGRAGGNNSNIDLGGNRCSSQFQCAWISTSSATCH